MNSIKRIIKEEINNYIINEINYNYHIDRFSENGHNIDGYGVPYSSENRNYLSHETGQFGSGTYFSSYKCFDDNRPELNKYDEIDSNGKSFIKVDDGIYRVDLNFYKNLYVVKSKKEAELLHETLRMLNSIFKKIEKDNMDYYDFEHLYYYVYINIRNLRLNIPSPKELFNIMVDYSNSNNIQTFGTYFMECNGYNGVNVNGICGYDNSKNGSVIYDLSKVSIEKVNFVKNEMDKLIYEDIYNYVSKNGIDEKFTKLIDGVPSNVVKSIIKTCDIYKIEIKSIIELEKKYKGITKWFLLNFNTYNKKTEIIENLYEIYKINDVDIFNIYKNDETLLCYVLKLEIEILNESFDYAIDIINNSWVSEIIFNIIPNINRKMIYEEKKLCEKLMKIICKIQPTSKNDNVILNKIIKILKHE